MYKWKKQPNRPICGQVAVSVIANCSIKKAIEIIGKDKTTKTKDLAKGLRKLGFKCSTRLKVLKNKPELAIGRLKNRKSNYSWHWVVIYKDKIFDGNYGDKFGKVKWKKGWRITSYLPVEKKP